MKRAVYIKGVRVYPHFENFALHPYAYMYGEIFSTLLRNEKIPSPHYQEIYFSIDKTIEGAKKVLFAEKWHKYTYSIINIDEYKKKNEKERDQIVFEALCFGLRSIAKEDNLDIQKIERVISTIKEKGVETELVYDEKDHKHFNLKIKYKVLTDHKQKTPFYLQVTNKESGEEATIHIADFQLLWVADSLANMIVKGNEIVIRGKRGVRSGWTREEEKLPEEFKFNLKDIFDHS